MEVWEVSQGDGVVCLKIIDDYHSSELILLNVFVCFKSQNLI